MEVVFTDYERNTNYLFDKKSGKMYKRKLTLVSGLRKGSVDIESTELFELTEKKLLCDIVKNVLIRDN
jgi:hypothetical protein